MGKDPLELIELRGTPREIGRQYGEACSETIKRTVDFWVKRINAANPRASRAGIVAAAQAFLPPVRDFGPDIIEEVTGLGEGAGIGFDEAFFLQTITELGLYYAKLAGCTSAAATGEATADGETFTAQNLDWAPGLELVVLRVKPLKGPEYLSLTYVGQFGLVGINAAGIAEQGNLITTTASRVGVPRFPVIMCQALRQKNLADAVGLIWNAKRASSGNYLFATADGDIIDVEATPDDIGFLYPERGILAHSNHCLTDRFRSSDTMGQFAPDSFLRAHRMTELMEKHRGKLSVDVMKKLMADHNDYPDAICRHADQDDPPERHMVTLAAIICQPKAGKIHAAYGNPCETEYVEYRL
ncbi:MAG: hypothetical protein HYX96_02090 [Chloroflexi bacterium]|nr:hypothetical protein [Chloroflexota bacterium]